MITGLTPSSSATLRAALPNRTYAHAIAHDDQRGRNDEATPATTSPASPRASRPMWIASSVEFGPGIRFVAPRKSRNSSRVSHPRRRTTSSSIIAMCAAGPPKPIVPSLRKSRARSPSVVRGLTRSLGHAPRGALAREAGRANSAFVRVALRSQSARRTAALRARRGRETGWGVAAKHLPLTPSSASDVAT